MVIFLLAQPWAEKIRQNITRYSTFGGESNNMCEDNIALFCLVFMSPMCVAPSGLYLSPEGHTWSKTFSLSSLIRCCHVEILLDLCDHGDETCYTIAFCHEYIISQSLSPLSDPGVIEEQGTTTPESIDELQLQ